MAKDQVSERFELGDRTLREHTARGTVINTAFQVGFAALGLLRRLIVAAFLTATEFGLWGILIVTLMTLLWLKQIGISDKYIQQSDDDQEAAFHKAFTLELLYSALFFAFICAALPVYAVVYGQSDIVLPGMVLASSILFSAFETPTWIAYRRMQFVKQRSLEAVNAVTAFVVAVGLAAAGAGYWSLVIGIVAGSVAGALAAVASSPYRLGLRFDRGTLREYASFSWPLVGWSLSNLTVVQGTVIVAERVAGLAGVGAIGLASSFSQFADRVDQIIGRTIYPAVCAVADRRPLLFETFVKSNRLALMWAMPFGIGLALFTPDLVTYLLGEKWRDAESVLQVTAVVAAFHQVGFNWTIFFRALGRTRPMFVASLVSVGSFAVVTVPLLLYLELDGYVIALAVSTGIQILVRTYFLSGLFEGFPMIRHLLRALLPSVPPVLVILGLRAGLGLERSAGLVIAELLVYLAATVAATLAFERPLLREIAGYLRGSRPTVEAAPR